MPSGLKRRGSGAAADPAVVAVEGVVSEAAAVLPSERRDITRWRSQR